MQTSGWEPWQDYTVKGWWIDDLWSAHKLSHEVYLDYAAEVRIGFLTRQRQVQALQDRERAKVFKVKQEAVAARLAPLKNSFLPDVLARLAPWQQQYTQDLDRFCFLVLRGASRSGKSSLAKALGKVLNLGVPFVQTVQSALVPDLRNYSDDTHGYIIFDNVNDQEFVLSQRALFQANNDIHTLGDSRTGIYKYDVWLYKVPIVITVDMTATWDPAEQWIAANCFDVLLGGPCYHQTPP